MPLEARKFIFTVSLCAMLAANPVLATAPTNDEDLGTTHDVYVESTLNQATNGIAGVSYVNRMVNAAGNAADAAEAHAAAAGAHALSAAQSADEAHKVLADKVNIDQGVSNKAMVTDDKGTIYPGYITNDMIKPSTIGPDKLNISGVMSGREALLFARRNSSYDSSGHLITGAIVLDYMQTDVSGVLISNSNGFEVLSSEDKSVFVGRSSGDMSFMPAVDNAVLYSSKEGFAWASASDDGQFMQTVQDSNGNLSFTFGGVPLKSIETPIVMTGVGLLMANSGVLSVDEYNPYTDTENTVLTRMPDGTIGWQKVETQNTDGVVGMVPVGSADATTFSQMWIE
ncbi:MAG: hypothetical protein J6R52_02240, partial [Alphaproteobacteria bacterium]|nr:hypothetical protein [Alphaproteobacteria bacterium]